MQVTKTGKVKKKKGLTHSVINRTKVLKTQKAKLKIHLNYVFLCTEC